MARFNEILAGRYNRFLQKLLQLKGGPPSAQLASEVMPVFPFFSGAENRYLESWDRFGARLSVAALAANSSGVQIRNPAGSNAMIVVEKMVQGSNASALDLIYENGTMNLDLTNIVTPTSARLDSRGRANPTAILSTQTATPGSLSFFGELFTAINVSLDFIVTDIGEIPLAPGDSIRIVSNVVNVGFSVSLMWRERALEESELK